LGRFDDGAIIGHFPAMLALVRGPDGQATSVHRTYLEGAAKRLYRNPEKLMGEIGTGSAIRLYPATDRLAIAEGIETALAVHRRTNWPVWAAISAHGLKGLVLPLEIHEVGIWGDADANYTGQR
jgi:putative DNA primase/helicase